MRWLWSGNRDQYPGGRVWNYPRSLSARRAESSLLRGSRDVMRARKGCGCSALLPLDRYRLDEGRQEHFEAYYRAALLPVCLPGCR